MTKKMPPQITVKQADPDTVNALISGQRRNLSALSDKQRYDLARIRVRLDVPAELKATLERTAHDLHTSLNDTGVALLIWALIAYWSEEDGELQEALAAGSRPTHCPRKESEIDPAQLLNKLRKTLTCASQPPPNGATERGA